MREIVYEEFYWHAMLRAAAADWPIYILLLVAILVGITVHEFGHAWMADRLGDPTPREEKRVSLSPLAHLDPLGTLLIIATTLIGYPIGWGKPVKTDPDAYRVSRRLGVGLVAAAGPLMNLITAIALAPIARFLIDQIQRGHDGDLILWATLLTAVVMLVNLSLFCFNLVPVYPLDGSHIAASVMPPALSEVYSKFMQRFGSYMLLGLIMSGVLGEFLGPIILTLFRLLIGL
ncbi:MAG TPA: site-2 protease family protein [Armatimonadaceae bacterium]|nr:site-2 protease family protein [Armatimonadaceae bacterium]